MKASTLKKFIKEALIMLLEEDEDIRELVSECLGNSSKSLIDESFSSRNRSRDMDHEQETIKVPADDLMFEDLMMIAEGRIPKKNINGILVRAPGNGMGYSKPREIREWATQAYDKLGGDWQEKRVGIDPSVKNFFETAFGNNNSQETKIEYDRVRDEGLLQEQVRNTKPTQIMREDGKVLDITDLLIDTAKTTYRSQPKSHSAPVSQPNDTADMIVGNSSPNELFGESAKKWGDIAFS